MTVTNYRVSDDNNIIRIFTPNKRDRKTASNKLYPIDKAIKMYFLDAVNGNLMTKEDYDKKIARMILGIDKEVGGEHDNIYFC